MSTSIDVPFRVVIDPFAEKHYVKDFQKKYKSHWSITRKAIVAQLNNVDLLIDSGRMTPPIYQSTDRQHAIHKHSFAIAGMKQSAKSSGNRLILYIDYKLRTVSILLLYGKNRIGSPNETAKWRAVIEKQYSEIIENFIV